jgi:Ca-activated chloride channel homolog
MVSADYLKTAAKHSKQVILIITDGEDNASGNTLEEVVRRVQDLQGPVVYSIGLLFDALGVFWGHSRNGSPRTLKRIQCT